MIKRSTITKRTDKKRVLANGVFAKGLIDRE